MPWRASERAIPWPVSELCPGLPHWQVTKVRVTKLVSNTYHARVHYAPGPGFRAAAGALPEELDVDARPSDAINLAVRFDAPIYISKEARTACAQHAISFGVPHVSLGLDILIGQCVSASIYISREARTACAQHETLRSKASMWHSCHCVSPRIGYLNRLGLQCAHPYQQRRAAVEPGPLQTRSLKTLNLR